VIAYRVGLEIRDGAEVRLGDEIGHCLRDVVLLGDGVGELAHIVSQGDRKPATLRQTLSVSVLKSVSMSVLVRKSVSCTR
jgi:hypothetical protein